MSYKSNCFLNYFEILKNEFVKIYKMSLSDLKMKIFRIRDQFKT